VGSTLQTVGVGEASIKAIRRETTTVIKGVIVTKIQSFALKSMLGKTNDKEEEFECPEERIYKRLHRAHAPPKPNRSNPWIHTATT
jgi:hypothetical protein